eukprot:4896159-Lingulodinium_polyedra.AAC.1
MTPPALPPAEVSAGPPRHPQLRRFRTGPQTGPRGAGGAPPQTGRAARASLHNRRPDRRSG